MITITTSLPEDGHLKAVEVTISSTPTISIRPAMVLKIIPNSLWRLIIFPQQMSQYWEIKLYVYYWGRAVGGVPELICLLPVNTEFFPWETYAIT
jgi:hypothetical protein